MAIDLEQIRRNYADFDDYKIEYIAKNEVRSLAPGVVSILREEIERRGLDANLHQGIEAQTREITHSELRALKSHITALPCPECGQRTAPLIGTLIREVKSYVFLTTYKKVFLISCPACAEKNRTQAIAVTATLGWWGFPSGLFYTVHALVASEIDRRHQDEQSEAILTAFVIQHIGEITTHFDRESALVDCIRRESQTN